MESNVNQLDLTVKLQALVYQDEDAWVARCPARSFGDRMETNGRQTEDVQVGQNACFSHVFQPPRGVSDRAVIHLIQPDR